MKKNKKKLKGMTLVEVLVALAIFTIMASLLVTACIAITNSVRNTNRMTLKINEQAPVAENRKTIDSNENENVSINISGSGVYRQIIVDEYTVKKNPDDNTSGDFKYFILHQ